MAPGVSNKSARKLVGSTPYLLRKACEKLLRLEKPTLRAMFATGARVVANSSRARCSRNALNKSIGGCPNVSENRAAKADRLIPATCASVSTVKDSDKRSKSMLKTRAIRGSAKPASHGSGAVPRSI